MVIQLILGDGGEVGADDGQHVHAQLLGLLGQADGVGGAGHTGTGVHGDTAVGGLDHGLDDPQLLILGLNVGLAVGAQAEDTVHTGGNLTVYLILDFLKIQGLVIVHGGDHCGNDAFHKLCHKKYFLS